MLYLLTLLASPVAVWICRRPLHAAINVALWALAIPSFAVTGILAVLLVPIIDALFVVNEYETERQVKRLIHIPQDRGLGFRKR
jgi:hypothetical protein